MNNKRFHIKVTTYKDSLSHAGIYTPIGCMNGGLNKGSPGAATWGLHKGSPETPQNATKISNCLIESLNCPERRPSPGRTMTIVPARPLLVYKYRRDDSAFIFNLVAG